MLFRYMDPSGYRSHDKSLSPITSPKSAAAFRGEATVLFTVYGGRYEHNMFVSEWLPEYP